MTALILGLLTLGAVLLVAEAYLGSFGMLGTAGSAAVIAGIVLTLLVSGGSFALVLAVTVPVAAAAVAVAVLATHKALSASRQRARCGSEGLIGQVAIVRLPLDPLGHVVVDGELWRARRSWAEEDDPPPAEGEPMVVDGIQGLTLSVRRAEVWELEP
jgi:membrane-bound ClpP family serine protease